MAKPRPPIVTILGHVDHGKTSLLDYIRKSRIAAKEHGGITQRIGAYEIETGIEGYPTDKITFIDTPGHEAFSKLRSRGATIADIAILVIDAKDSLMPQTVESIQHIKTANIPFVIALNKIDLPDANPEKVKIDLLKYEVLVEDKGGTVPVIPISALKGTGINDLLETILFISSDRNLTFDPTEAPEGYIIETKKDKRGVVVSMIPKNGTFTVGDTIYSQEQQAKVRSMVNDLGKQLKTIEPCTPVELLGFSEIPEVGTFISNKEGLAKAEEKAEEKKSTMDQLRAMLSSKKDTAKKLSVIIKADSQGSLEAILESIKENENIEVQLSGVGDIHKSDVFLAKTTRSLIIGFSINVDTEVRELAKQEKVIIKTYTIIYELLDELLEVSELLLEREQQEKSLKGEAKIRATFIIEGETIFGIQVTKGKINNGDQLEVYRNNEPIGKTKLVSLKQRAKIIQEVKKDQEGGMIFYPQLDIKVGDVVKSIL